MRAQIAGAFVLPALAGLARSPVRSHDLLDIDHVSITRYATVVRLSSYHFHVAFFAPSVTPRVALSGLAIQEAKLGEIAISSSLAGYSKSRSTHQNPKVLAVFASVADNHNSVVDLRPVVGTLGIVVDPRIVGEEVVV